MRITKKKKLEKQVQALMGVSLHAVIIHAIYHGVVGQLNMDFLNEVRLRMSKAQQPDKTPEGLFNLALKLTTEMVAEGKQALKGPAV